MVTRKPVGPPLSTGPPPSDSNASVPYPITPRGEDEPQTASSVYSDDLDGSQAFDLIDISEAQDRPRRDSDVSSHGTWDSDNTEHEDDTPQDEPEVPKPLNVRASRQNMVQEAAGKRKQDDELPAILKPGPVNGIVGTRSPESRPYEPETQGNPWQLESNNPYLQKSKQPAQTNAYAENSQKIWEQPVLAHVTPPPPPPPPVQAPPLPPSSQTQPSPPQAPPPPVLPAELPAVKTPTEELSNFSLGGRKASYYTAEVLPVPQQGQHPLPPVTKTSTTDAQAFPSTNPWSGGVESQNSALPNEAYPVSPLEPVAPICSPPSEPPPEKQADAEYAPPPGSPPGRFGPLIDHVEPRQHQPPRISTQSIPLSPRIVTETPGARDKRKRNEHYQIKHVNWYDSASGKAGLRQSPVLTQNENGPCPLLALVNALVLSTPPDADTALVEALRTREQVSLGLLLDAVFDELMSGRRGDTGHALPDVSELYAFLLALHTGMNVNPRFVTPAISPRGSLDGHPPELHNLHPLERSQDKPGCFEETNEMRLYSTFNVPLIHGWTVPKDAPAYAAFMRSAQTFEDAQNIQFAEAELEDKLRTEGLSFQEQQSLDDIQTIKRFLQNWPTQLTDHGLDTISKSLKSGQIAILFRNDHFSTLYKEPRHGALMTLVTDAGYSSHDEIVWESLVDVNGAASEMFSGDFRVVSHSQDTMLNQGSSAGGNEGWQTVQHGDRYKNSQQSQSSAFENPPPLPGPRPTLQSRDENTAISHADHHRKASEQEDHDLALALQLQEEEEDQQRQAEARRRREQELSEQFLSNEEQPPAIPPRRQAQGQGRGATNRRSSRQGNTNAPATGGTTTTPATPARATAPSARPAVNRPVDVDDPDAPPSYEQSASDRPYRPAGTTAPPTQGNPLNTLDALRRQQSAYAQQSTTSVNHPVSPGGGNRIQRRSSQIQGQPAPAYPGRVQNGAATIRDTDERCVVM